MRTRTTVLSGVIAALAVAGGMAVAPMASAATENRKCVGREVIRCVDFSTWGSETGVYVSPVVSIRDADGGGDYQVGVNEVRLQRLDSDGEWRTLYGTRSNDYDGWWPYRDRAYGGSYRISDYSDSSDWYRTIAVFYWKRSGSSTISKVIWASPPGYRYYR